MKQGLFLFAAIAVGVMAAPVLAQRAPPGLGTLGPPAPPGPQVRSGANDRGRAPPQDGRRTSPREFVAGLIDYMDGVDVDPVEYYDSIVMGYGNEDLWEDFSRKRTPVPAKVASRK